MPMLKARIFSNHPEQADGLAEVLRQQGYLAEVLRPGQAQGAPADLEIVLETCTGGDAIRRAAELAQEFDADVVVAPGTVISTPPIREAMTPFAESGREPALTEPTPELRPKSMAPDLSETYQHASPEAGEPQWQTSAGAPGVLGRAAPKVAVTLTAWAASAREALSSAADQAREYREHALTRFALLRANREEHLLELTQRRIEAQEQASHLASARKNAAAYLLQLERESGATIRPSSRGLEQETVREAPVRAWRALFEGFMERVRPVRWDAALAGLASAGALFAVGLAVASFGSKPNLTMGKEPPVVATPTPVSGVSAPQAASTTSASIPKAAPSHVESRKPSPAQRSAPARTRGYAGRDREEGNDVVIRHLVSPSPTPKQQAQGWKHFSDIDH